MTGADLPARPMSPNGALGGHGQHGSAANGAGSPLTAGIGRAFPCAAGHPGRRFNLMRARWAPFGNGSAYKMSVEAVSPRETVKHTAWKKFRRASRVPLGGCLPPNPRGYLRNSDDPGNGSETAQGRFKRRFECQLTYETSQTSFTAETRLKRRLRFLGPGFPSLAFRSKIGARYSQGWR